MLRSEQIYWVYSIINGFWVTTFKEKLKKRVNENGQ